MKVPQTDKPEKYVGLYLVDFGQQVGLGYTAEEVAMLLESQRYQDAKVYKVHRAKPDGSMELVGIPRQRFMLESGMFFHCLDEDSGRQDFATLQQWSEKQAPPCRAKLQLVRAADGQLLLALIYPAEYEDEMGTWLADSGFRGRGPVDAGISQVERFYQQQHQILLQEQLWPIESLRCRNREELFAAVGTAIQR